MAGGLGLGVISAHAMRGQDKQAGVRVLSVEGFPLASAWHMVHRANQKLSPVALAFRRHLLDTLGGKA